MEIGLDSKSSGMPADASAKGAVAVPAPLLASVALSPTTSSLCGVRTRLKASMTRCALFSGSWRER